MRHQELKMQEEYNVLAKKLKEEYDSKMKDYETMIEQQKRQIQDQHYTIVCLCPHHVVQHIFN